LYPTIGLWAALLKSENLYELAQKAFENNFSHLPVNLPADEFLNVVWDECGQSDNYKELSCIKNGLWTLLLIACKHYRLPVPINFTLDYRKEEPK